MNPWMSINPAELEEWEALLREVWVTDRQYRDRLEGIALMARTNGGLTKRQLETAQKAYAFEKGKRALAQQASMPVEKWVAVDDFAIRNHRSPGSLRSAIDRLQIPTETRRRPQGGKPAKHAREADLVALLLKIRRNHTVAYRAAQPVGATPVVTTSVQPARRQGIVQRLLGLFL